jgi:two-component system sensor histidine kinase RegB
MRIHLKGMWIAFTLAAAFIGYFLHKVQRARAKLESELSLSRAREARSEKLSALATLAAGAAHELSTPLSTIAVAAKEMERRLRKMEDEGDGQEGLLEDATLIRGQIERCRAVLEQVSADAGASLADGATVASLDTLLGACRDGLARADMVLVDRSAIATGAQVRLPVRSVAMAMRGLIKNALDASPDEARVHLVAATERGALVLEVRDRGAGMSPEVEARAGEPFFTTKEEGKGMGLGLFLAGAVAEHLGGSLRLRTALSEGTTVVVTLPSALVPDHSPVREQAPALAPLGAASES